VSLARAAVSLLVATVAVAIDHAPDQLDIGGSALVDPSISPIAPFAGDPLVP
jgi:hypothetical protein